MSEDWGDLYLDHYEKYFRKPVESTNFEFDGRRIQLLAYDRVFPGCRVFASYGLTHFRERLDGVAEVFMPVDTGWKIMPAILACTLDYMLVHGMQIGYGISISGVVEMVDREFSNKYNKSAVYFSRPFGLPSGFAEIHSNDQIGNMFLAFLLTKQEHEYFCDRGSNHLEQVLQEKKVDPYYVARRSCI